MCPRAGGGCGGLVCHGDKGRRRDRSEIKRRMVKSGLKKGKSERMIVSRRATKRRGTVLEIFNNIHKTLRGRGMRGDRKM